MNCIRGRNRSPALMLMFVIVVYGCSIHDAMMYIISLRPLVEFCHDGHRRNSSYSDALVF